MIREVDLASYLPPFMQAYQEPVEALRAEEPEFNIVWKAADRILYNHFISTADEEGIARFEKLLGIIPLKADTLESRRARVQARWFHTIPYTMRALSNKLIELCGGNNFTIRKEFDSYRIIIETGFELFGMVDELEKLTDEIIPCNLIIDLRNTIRCRAEGSLHFGTGISCRDIFLLGFSYWGQTPNRNCPR